MKATQNYHNGHTKFEFGMTIVVIMCGLHTLEFAMYKLAKMSGPNMKPGTDPEQLSFH